MSEPIQVSGFQLTSGLETIGIVKATASGVVASGKSSVTLSVTVAGVSINGVDIGVGRTLTFSAYLDPISNIYKRVPEITYTITNVGELLISYID